MKHLKVNNEHIAVNCYLNNNSTKLEQLLSRYYNLNVSSVTYLVHYDDLMIDYRVGTVLKMWIIENYSKIVRELNILNIMYENININDIQLSINTTLGDVNFSVK